MRRILARFGAEPGADYRAVFSEFGRRMERVLRRRAAPKIRAVAG
jgi:hypothetical protein